MLTPSLAIITPVFNDWESFCQLLAALDAATPEWNTKVDVIAVDDGSSKLPEIDEIATDLDNLGEITIISLAVNMGHQRAIAIGLAQVNQNSKHDRYLVMDCDGEDRPEEIVKLLRLSVEKPNTIIAAERVQRSESWRFRAFYVIYKGLFRLLTGRRINFGNFCLIPKSQLARITHMAELWNHFAGAIIRSQAPLASVSTSQRASLCRAVDNELRSAGRSWTERHGCVQRLHVRSSPRRLTCALRFSDHCDAD